MDNLAPVSGADVRMLRLLAGCVSGRLLLWTNRRVYCTRELPISIPFWSIGVVVEAREDNRSRSFRVVADVQVKTGLPHDLHVLKVR